MKPNLKRPRWGREFVIILIGTGILIGLLPVLELKNQETENWAEVLTPGNLAMVGRNSLLPISDPSGPEPQTVQKIPVVITAYSSSPWETDNTPYITAAGTWVRDGIVANNYFPFETKIRIPQLFGDKIFVVEDRMHWTKGDYHIDVWLSNYEQALNFGAKRTYIEVLEN